MKLHKRSTSKNQKILFLASCVLLLVNIFLKSPKSISTFILCQEWLCSNFKQPKVTANKPLSTTTTRNPYQNTITQILQSNINIEIVLFIVDVPENGKKIQHFKFKIVDQYQLTNETTKRSSQQIKIISLQLKN